MRNLGFGADLKPAIQESILERLLRRIQIPAAVSFAQHQVQMSLSIPESAVDSLVHVLALFHFRIAAVVRTYEPGTSAAPCDLTEFSCHRNTSADARHTGGTRKRAIELFRLNLRMWALIGVQLLASLDLRRSRVELHISGSRRFETSGADIQECSRREGDAVLGHWTSLSPAPSEITERGLSDRCRSEALRHQESGNAP